MEMVSSTVMTRPLSRYGNLKRKRKSADKDKVLETIMENVELVYRYMVPALTSFARRRTSTTPTYPVGLKRRGSRGFSNAEFHFNNIRTKAKNEMLANLILPAFAEASPKLVRERRITYGCHPASKRTKKDEKRFLATKEILVTEKSYLTCLSTLKTIFEDPMREGSLLGSKDLDVIFPKELVHIRESHTLFMNELEERIQNWRQYGIVGDIFTKLSSSYHINVLMIYSNYVNNFPKAIAVINKFLRASHKFRKFLEDCSMEPTCAGLDLPAYLLTPIQRLPRYVLLLRQVSKYTDASHPDSFHLKIALETMTQMINVLNDSIQNSHRIVSNAPPRKITKKRSLKKKASLKELKNKKDTTEIISRVTPDTSNTTSIVSTDSGNQPTPLSSRTTGESTQESLTSTPSSPTSEMSPPVSLGRVRSGAEKKGRPVSTGDLDQFYEADDHLKEFASIVEENEDRDHKSTTHSKLKMAKESMKRTWQRRSKKWRRSVDDVFPEIKSDSTSALTELSLDFPSPVENRPTNVEILSTSPPSPTASFGSTSASLAKTSASLGSTIPHTTHLIDSAAEKLRTEKSDENSAELHSSECSTENKNEVESKQTNDDSVTSSGLPSSPDISPCDTLTRRRRKFGECRQRPISLMLPSQLSSEGNGVLNSELRTTNSESHMVASEPDVWVPRSTTSRSRFTRSSSDDVRQFAMRSRQASVTSSGRRVSSGSNASLNESEDSGVSGTPDTSPSNTLRTRKGCMATRSLSTDSYKTISLRQRRSWEKLFVSGMEHDKCMVTSDVDLEKQTKQPKGKKKFRDVVKQLFSARRKNSLSSIADIIPKTSSPPTSPTRQSFAVSELGEKISTV